MSKISDDKQALSIEAARLYYQADYSQQQIANRLGLSRPTVSRLLQHAKQQGYVRIEIHDPRDTLDELAARLVQHFGLKEARLCHSPLDQYEEIQRHLSETAAEWIHDNVKDGDIIGVTWGTTMYAVARRLAAKPIKNVEVVQLKGGISHSEVDTHAFEIAHRFADAFHTVPHYLPLPVIFASQPVKRMAEADPHVRRIIELGRRANIAVFTVGVVSPQALLFQLGYFDQGEIAGLLARGVGDICSRVIDAEGRIVSPELDARTVGIRLEELKTKESSVLVAGGAERLDAIHAALRGGYANVLITDQYSARALLDHV
ncbi:sugar-binding transcriptional regulator [Halotalea alkalilenta]|uniref:sugar-binding transcriptional regulator n=1 Tax=Halotalea alkalilenta TaxID=376489 RepID=UPI000AB9D675|nr:sugar-binding transcriptional regulator [Halotalea alkalilenta]